jgi:hypothetical protein
MQCERDNAIGIAVLTPLPPSPSPLPPVLPDKFEQQAVVAPASESYVQFSSTLLGVTSGRE